MSKLIIPAVIALHLLCVAKPLLAAPAPAGTVVMPPAVVKPCVTRPLVQGSGSVRVCPGGQL